MNRLVHESWEWRWSLVVRGGLAVAVACACGAAFASVTTLSGGVGRNTVRGDGGVASQSFTASTIHQDAYPEEVAAPAFWFDCGETNGWLFAEENGVTYVTNVPSKVGSRYLTLNAEGGHWKAYTLERPMFVPGGDKVRNRNVLDFGAMDSKRGLIFNSHAYGGCSASNVLENIGTVITVFDASQGGGYLLGGGCGWLDDGSWFNSGCMFLRNGNNPMKVKDASYSPYNPVGRGSTKGSWNQGTLRRNGCVHRLQYVGFAETWEVVSVICTNNNLNAFGVAVGDTRYAGTASGGQRIAEMLIFDRVLSVDDVAKIERWLQRKWLDDAPLGVNGNAPMGSLYADRTDWTGKGFPIKVDVPEGETVSLYKNQHGRGGCYNSSVEGVTNLSSFVKTGKGTFALCDAANFQGVVRLQEGRLTVPQRAVPAALPPEPFVHMDASMADSLVTETDAGTGVEYVKAWRNLDPAKTLKDQPVVARPLAAANRPALRRDELGAGLNVLDFGVFMQSLSGRYLVFTTNETSETVAPYDLPQCMTVVAVVGAQEGGGHVVGNVGDNYFRRCEQNPTIFYNSLFAHQNDATRAYVNGFPISINGEGYEHAGYQVYALRQAGDWVSTLRYLGAWGTRSGGLRLAEVAIYFRTLTDDEMRDAEAHLMRKWLGRTAPGYAFPATFTAPMVQNIRVEGNAEIHVPAGETLVVGTVSGDHDLVKTGAGTLKIQRNEMDAETRLVAREGAIEMARGPDVATACELASAPSAHFDPDQTNAMVLVEGEGGDRTVRIWADATHANAAFQPTVEHQPHLVTENGPNGHAWLDFGSLLTSNGGRGVNLARALNNVRAAYVVCRFAAQPEGETGNYPMPLGSKGTWGGQESVGGTICDFLRQWNQLLSSNGGCACAYYGQNFTNGVSCAANSNPLTETWQLVEYHPAGGSHVSAFGVDRGTVRGGFGLGEVVLYERPLTAREKVATRNYLMKKWLGTSDADLAPLEALAEQKIVRLTGEGTFAKTEPGTLTVGDWSAFNGTVDVAAGTLALGKTTLVDTGSLVTDGLILQMDASQGVTAATNGNDVQITEWASALGDDWTARPAKADKYPTYIVADELNGGRVVDMAASGAQQALVFYKDGVRTAITNIRTAFWMFGSQNGGGFLMGGGENPELASDVNRHRLFWHRGGGNAGFGAANAGEALVNGAHAAAMLKTAAWRKNGVDQTYETGLSGAWDLLSMRIPENAAYDARAEGFAFDGRYLDTGGYTERLGSQRLAEVLLYDRRLSDAEILQVEAYLRAKWQFGVQSGAATGVDVSVGAGATLDLGGGLQQVGAIAGAGTVENGTLQPTTLVADGAATAWPTVASLALTAATRVELVNLAVVGDLRNKEIKVLAAADVTGLDLLTSSCFAGEDYGRGLAARIVAHDGALYVRFRGKGLTMVLR